MQKEENTTMNNANLQVLLCESNLITEALTEINGWEIEEVKNFLEGLQESINDIIYDETY